MEVIKWLEDWFELNCNGDWEHENFIKIQSTSNPGWHIEISLNYTLLDGVNIDYFLEENSDNDWYGYKVENNKYVAAGDCTKLIFLLELFKSIIISAPDGADLQSVHKVK